MPGLSCKFEASTEISAQLVLKILIQPLRIPCPPHLDGDAEARDEAEEHQAMEGQRKELVNIHARITAKDIRRFGYTDGCRRCSDLMNKVARPSKHGNNECRLRMYLLWQEVGGPKWEAVKHLVNPDEPVVDRTEPVEVAEVDHSRLGIAAPETPPGRPWDPMPADADLSSGR